MGKVKNYLAFDLGASNGRAILGQFDGEKITMTELHRFENNYIEMNGVYYWDTPNLYNQLKQGLLKFVQGGYGELDSFGIDTWGVDFGLLDKNGQLAGLPVDGEGVGRALLLRGDQPDGQKHRRDPALCVCGRLQYDLRLGPAGLRQGC